MSIEDIYQFLEPIGGVKFLYAIIALLLVWVLFRILRRAADKSIASKSTRYQAKKLLTLIGYLIAIIAVLAAYQYEFSNITLAVGLAGAGIAFALQEVIVSFAGFLAILSGSYYKVGDRIEIAGVKGDVVDIGVLRTTLMQIGDWVDGDLYNGKMVRVANSYLFKDPVYNYSGDFPFLWDEIQIPIKHKSNYKLAEENIEAIVTEETLDFTNNSESTWDKLTKELYVEKARIAPLVTMKFDENWITFTVRYVVDFKRRRITKDALYRKIFDMISAHPNDIFIASAAYEVMTIEEEAGN